MVYEFKILGSQDKENEKLSSPNKCRRLISFFFVSRRLISFNWLIKIYIK